MTSLRALKIKKARLDIRVSELKILDREMRLCPHLNLPVNVTLDGNHWVCIFQSDLDPLKCVVAYGESPSQACNNFDNLWNGAGVFRIDNEEEEQEQF